MTGSIIYQKLPPEKQDKVFGAAASEFARKGFEAASMNAVVAEAGISKGSLFQYFSSKLKLFDAVVSFATRTAKSRLRQARDESRGAPLRRRLGATLRAGFLFIEEHPHLARVYFRLLHSGEAPFGTARIRTLHRQSIDFLSQLLEDARACGELRPQTDIARTAFLINSLMQHLLHAYYTQHLDSELGLYRGEEEDLDTWIDATLDLVTRGVLQSKPDKA